MSVTIPFRTQMIIAAAALGCVALTVLAITLLPRISSYGTADLLPAEETLLFAQNLNHASAQRLLHAVPLLRDAPLTDVPSDMALVRMADGSAVWITLRPDPQGGRPEVTATDERALALLGGERPLSADTEYRALARLEGTTRVFARPAVLLPEAGAAHPVMAALTEDAVQIGFIAPQFRLPPAETPFRQVPDLLMTLQAGDGAAFARMLGGFLSADERTVADALVRQKLAGLFGTGLSPVYDLLPLLDGPSTLYVARGNGRGIVAVEGTTNDAAGTMAALHDAFRATLSPAVRTQRVFDDEFPFDSLSADEASLSDETSTDGGWAVRSSAGPDRGLYSAVMGSRFIVTPDKDLLLRLIRTPAVAADTAVAMVRGTVDPAALQAVLRENGFTPGVLSLLPSGNPPLHWELNRRGNLAVLRLY